MGVELHTSFISKKKFLANNRIHKHLGLRKLIDIKFARELINLQLLSPWCNRLRRAPERAGHAD